MCLKNLLVCREVHYLALLEVRLGGGYAVGRIADVEKKRRCEIRRDIERRRDLLGVKELNPARAKSLLERLQHHVRTDN